MIKSFVTITILTLLWIRNVDKYYEKTNYKKIKEREREKKAETFVPVGNRTRNILV